MRYLAIDLGDKRTGLAVGDTVTGLVGLAGQLDVSIKANDGEQLLAAIVKAVRLHAAAGLVMGLPLNMDDSEGPRAKGVRAFAARVEQATKLAVRFQDERLTTAEADWSMARSGLTRGQKKEKRDQIAARILLEEFLKLEMKNQSVSSEKIDGFGEAAP